MMGPGRGERCWRLRPWGRRRWPGGPGRPARADDKDKAREAEAEPAAASESIVLGFIGVGGMGTGLLNIFKGFPDVRVAAVCDVYEPHLRRAQSAADGKPEVYSDFRKVLDRKDIDAVVIATPDHWHAIPTILACQAGKDVYCEKPLTHRIAEGRAVVTAAEKHKRVTQMGNLIHAGENYHRVVEIVRSGVLGKISKTRVWMAADRSGLGKPADGDPAGRLRLRLLARPRPEAAVQPQPLHLQLAVVLGLRRRPPDRLLLPHRRPRPLGDGGRRPADHLGHRRPLRPRRQRRDARHARGRLRIREGRPELPDGLEPDRREHPRPRGHGPGHHVPGDRGHARRRLRHLQDHPREGPDDRRAAQDAAALGRPSSRVAERHQDPGPVLVQLRLRPPAQLRRPPRQHRPLDRREAEVGRRRRADSPTTPRPTGSSPRNTASPGCLPEV